MAYRRILPRERGLFTYAELWAEDDHLLSVRSQRLSSFYQRFPLSEIQGITVTRLPHWTVPQIAWLAGTVMLFVVSVLAPRLLELRVVFGALTIWPLLWAARELWRGPRCRTTVHTSTGAHTWPAVARLSRAQLMLATVPPLIEAVQGRVEQLEVAPTPFVHPEEDARAQLQQDRLLRLVCFGLLLLEAMLSLAFWLWPKIGARLEVGLFAAGLGITMIVLLLIVWRNARPVLRKDRAYLLCGAALGLNLSETLLWVSWMVSNLRPIPEGHWMHLIGPAWRIPLALTGLALELRRK